RCLRLRTPPGGRPRRHRRSRDDRALAPDRVGVRRPRRATPDRRARARHASQGRGMNVKELKKRWASLFSNDSYAGAACSFCSKPRAAVAYLVEGPRAYICDECALLSLEVCAQHENAKDVWPKIVAAVLDAMPRNAPYAQVEPLLVGELALAT